MGRIPRIYYDNAVYHVTVRGNNRKAVFGKAEDKEMFLRIINKYKKRFLFKFFGFVIMDNHAHLVIRSTALNDISKIMHSINLSFSRNYGIKYELSGHIWQGRFKSELIETEGYALNCLEYIHNNPVRAGMAESAADYFWSSYRFYHEEGDRSLEGLIEIDRFEE
ncbi:MAG: transposase [Candidatus Omnitrophota bacterium]|jgi:REP element-mobilizing transposase RayT